MKKIGKLSLTHLGKEDLTNREMSQVRGGNNSGCGCAGASPKASNSNAYWGSSCSWEGDNCVYGGSKASGMP